jgi:hypothetical protein
MKKILFVLSLFASVTVSAQFSVHNCEQVTDTTCRIRIVTLSNPQPWQPIPIPFTVEQDGCRFVYYSADLGSYCDMLQLIEDKLKGTPYAEARVVFNRKPCKQ